MLPFFHPHQRTLLLIAFIALAHSFAFMIYQQPDWETQWTDQGGYHQLASNLAFHGVFTRFPDATPFVPEVIRTPGYPLFVALLYQVFGPSHWAVAAAQAVLFSIICLLVHQLAREVTTPRVALVAAATTALFPPIPYYGALILTEIWTTFLITLGLWLLVKAFSQGSVPYSTAAGVILGIAGLSRPIFFLLPVLLFLGATVMLKRRPEPRRTIGFLPAGAFLLAYVLTLAPWFGYNYHHFQKLTISPAGGIGRSSWEGYWNGKFPGRTQATLTHLAESPLSDEQLSREVRSLLNADDDMLRYVDQWRNIRRLYAVAPDASPHDRIFARVKADRIFGEYAKENIRREPFRYLIRRFTYGMFVLWVGEIPIRYSDINRTSAYLIHGLWAIQAGLLAFSVLGAIRLLLSTSIYLMLPLVLAPLYLSLVQWPFLTESRYSLPLKPLLLLFAVVGFDWTWDQIRQRFSVPRSSSQPLPRT